MRYIILLVLVVFLQPCCASCAADEPERVALSAGSVVIGEIPASPGALPPSDLLGAGEGYQSGWQLQQTVNKVLKAVSFADPMNGYAAAELGGVYRSTDGGQS